MKQQGPIVVPSYVRYELHVFRDWIFVQEKTGWLRDQIKTALWFEEEKPKTRKKKGEPEEEVAPYHYDLYRESGAEFKFLSGLLSYVKEKIQLDPQFVVRKWSPTNFGTIPDDYLPGIILRSYQIAAGNKMLAQNKGIIDLPTRSGKTEVGAAVTKKYLESNPDAVCLFIEPSTVLMRQTYRKLLERGIPCGRIGGGYKELKGNHVFSCVIDTLAVAAKRKSGPLYELIQGAKFIFLDESHLMGAPSYVDTLSTVINYDILLVTSGTPYQDRVGPKTNARDAWVSGTTGGVVFTVSSSFLVGKGWIAQGNVVVMTYSTRRPNFFMRYYPRVYDYFIVNNWNRNSLGANCARDLYERGFKVMILVWRIPHGEEMLRLCAEWCGSKAVFAHGTGTNFMEGGQIRNKSVDYDPVVEFNKGGIPVLIGSDVFKLGADLPDLDAVVIMRGEGRKYINTIQSVARCLCPNKWDNKVYIVDFWDGWHPYTKLHSELRINDYIEVGHQVYRGYEDFTKLIDASSQLRRNAKVHV